MESNKKMAKTLFIIGNGFDCYGHGLKTKYSDFKNYIIEKYPEYNDNFDGILESRLMPDGDEQYNMDDLAGAIISIMDECAGERWSDFESAMGIKYADSIWEKMSWFLQDVDWKAGNDEIKNTLYQNEDLSNDVTGGYIELKELFSEWAFDELARIDFSQVKKIKKPSFSNAAFLNFNYTSTLEDLYRVPEERVCHIHGFAKDWKSEIMVGHGDDDSAEVSGMHFEVQEAFDSLVRALRKNTIGAMERCSDFWDKIVGITKIYSYGFSFSTVDMCYIDAIAERIKPNKVRWYFNSYDWKNNRGNVEKIRSYGFKVRKCSRW